jgi:hypothetical protein
LSTTSTSSQFALPKALQPNASRSVGFFNAHLLIQASLIRNFALKKPVTYVTGFVANIELHSKQIWNDLREFYSLIGVFEKSLKIKKATD